MLDPSVFKAYDVRGIYPTQLDEDGAYAIGRGYVEQFEPRRMAVGRDMRLSGPQMQAAAMQGAADAGAEVLDLGLIGTEMLYFAVGELGLDGGITVTASHNPKEYTGMKIVRRGALPVGGESGLLDVRDRAMSGARHRDVSAGTVAPYDIWPAYVDRVMSFVDVSALRPLRVVIDAANGMAGAMLPPVLERLPIDVVRCFFDPDGSFPNHEPNPLLPENREFIVRTTLEEGADLGVAFDGDADRCFFVDDTGEFIPGDFVTALFAETVLAKEPGAKIIYDVRASWAVPETIENAGGVALMNRVGHAYIKQRMRKDDAAFGGEVSGHYYFRDFSQADTGVVPFLLMLELVSRQGREAVGGPASVPRALLHHRRTEHAGRRRRAEVAGAEGAVRARGADLAPRRHLRRRRRLALQRPPVEHRAAAPPQPRGAHAGADGAQARRGAGADPRVVRLELGRTTDRRLPFKYSALTRVGFSDTDAQGIVYYGRYLPYFDLARTEYLRHLGLLGRVGDGEFVMRAQTIEYFAPARFDDTIEIFCRQLRIGRTSATFEEEAYRVEDDALMVTAQQTVVYVDVAERKAIPIPDAYRDAIRAFEGSDVEA